ncbi:alpha-amylase domain protein, partial [Vibrio parahaemolyticus V-223/04]
LLPLLGKMAP